MDRLVEVITEDWTTSPHTITVRYESESEFLKKEDENFQNSDFSGVTQKSDSLRAKYNINRKAERIEEFRAELENA